MAPLIFVSLAIMPLSALIFGALVFLYKFKKIHVPSFLIFGLLTMYVDLHYFYRAYQVSLKNELWGPAAMTMGSFSLAVTLNCLAFGLLGSVIYSLLGRVTRKKDVSASLSPLFMGLVVVLSVATAAYQMQNHQQQSESQKLVAKASGDLTPEIISEIVNDQLQNKDATVISTLLQNPQCPQSVLNDFAGKSEIVFKTSVLKNPNVSPEIVEKLATDQNEVVRYHVAISDKISLETLQKLAKDSAKDVRLKAQAILENKSAQ